MTNDLRYTKDHEWVRLVGGVGRIGITDHAQQQLGDVVFVELPKVGAAVTAGGRTSGWLAVGVLGGIHAFVASASIDQPNVFPQNHAK